MDKRSFIKKAGIAAGLLSGYPDSNGGPPGPKPGTLTNCATSRLDYKGMQKP